MAAGARLALDADVYVGALGVRTDQRAGARHPDDPLADAATDDVLGVLATLGLYMARHRRRGLHRIRCPWAETHSGGESEAVVLEPGASPAPGWGFRCMHAHCIERHIGELLDVLGLARRRGA
jgi:hypothetical protein